MHPRREGPRSHPSRVFLFLRPFAFSPAPAPTHHPAYTSPYTRRASSTSGLHMHVFLTPVRCPLVLFISWSIARIVRERQYQHPFQSSQPRPVSMSCCHRRRHALEAAGSGSLLCSTRSRLLRRLSELRVCDVGVKF